MPGETPPGGGSPLDPFLDDEVPIEDLIEAIWPEPPVLFDPENRLSPQERRLGYSLRDAGFQPVRVTQLDNDAFGLWEFRIRHQPELEPRKAARALRKRLLAAIRDAEIMPLEGALTEVVSKAGIRRFVFATQVP
jgi:hypothetical protein